MKTSYSLTGPVSIFAFTMLFIIFYCKPRAIAKLWLVDISHVMIGMTIFNCCMYGGIPDKSSKLKIMLDNKPPHLFAH